MRKLPLTGSLPSKLTSCLSRQMAHRKRDPTPEEIQLACLAIQRTWTPATERRRRGDTLKRVDSIRQYILELDRRDGTWYLRVIEGS
jgi:hypothetical protein